MQVEKRFNPVDETDQASLAISQKTEPISPWIEGSTSQAMSAPAPKLRLGLKPAAA